MELWLTIIGIAAFAIFALRWDQRFMERRARHAHNRATPIQADPRVIALLIEHQAKMDMACLAVRMLITTHPRGEEIKQAIAEIAPELMRVYSEATESPSDLYRNSIEAALNALLGDK
ncbi:hypothetical protein [Burkholderia pseudomallei]|uniref:hypothetical protein n=1 Tax=Burkholderia pseudomallei TaxID=28450 RepID=UPI000F201FC1|nr:hypothetical protein [Burkholderia pseudomallei]CAJ2932768.1 Uncharacterised protein [Burkholderia pseudomallei]CAJ3455605.1 Uncharacterised protein [Burkholderia pseudomallei]CAJ4920323.1 Uncharacterised protein [Burkholderia pseudomallei]CAJ5913734.1 Uncharacterised protein [Burkholderia pseudomallei]CAJ6697697.1 Uncharacterised protein [Burkholderia pseudomallei]